MNTKIIVGGALAIVLLGGIFIISQPEEVVAPMTTNEEKTQTTDTPITETTVTQPVAGNTETTNSVGSGQGAPTQTKAASTKPSTKGSLIEAPAPFIGTVYYDGSTFIPETITIVQGGTVQFVNIGEREMWIGSNNHPDHKRYPVKSATDCLGSSFDQCGATGKGSTWSFTFTELGEWRYHNHTRPIDEGDVIVLTKEQYLKFQEVQQ